MKLILFTVAFLALAKSSVQLSCYECKSADYRSSIPAFNDQNIQVCGENQKQWPTKNTTQTGFDKCKKLVEKITVNNKDEQLVIRTTGPNDMGLKKDVFTEYTCDTDLCNSAVTMCATAFAVVLSIIATLTTTSL